RGLIVCGPGEEPGLAVAVTALAARLGYPVLADPLSGVRCGPHHTALVLAGYDAFLRDPAWVAALEPEVVLRFGAMPTAKPLLLYLQAHPSAHIIVVDAAPGWRDPTALAAEMVYADPALLCTALLGAFATGAASSAPTSADMGVFDAGAASSAPTSADMGAFDAGAASSAPTSADMGVFDTGAASSTPTDNTQYAIRNTAWSKAWQEAERRTQATVAAHFAALDGMAEGKVFAELAAALPDGATLYVGNSMPIRDLDTFFPGGPRPIRILGNRGANGIDGVVSSALGASTAGGPLVLVIGDLSFYHDMNGLLAAKLHGLNATIVLLNNDGGGIFHFLPQAGEHDVFEAVFGTPTGLDFAPAVAMYGGRLHRPTTWPAFRGALADSLATGGLNVIEVRTEREQNVTAHRAIWPAVSAALADLVEVRR
ncbi:MAG: thiamine pyrophosphate-dependent enzyme, partial [Chloroflexota bacterium]|nr:thiamine pyrophosphate-dependent enzyme [Chloroflexota bacterium]